MKFIRTSMKVHVLEHAPFEGLGSIETWLFKLGATVQYTRFYESGELPDPVSVDLVIAMGGPMSANDEAKYPWLEPEKRFIREAIGRGRPVLGVCLGAQLIASALGAPVYANREKEIGWFPIEGVEAGGESFRFPQRVTVFHWHGETFDLPRGAVRLARSSACENQAFQIGRNVIGLQFHLETRPEMVELMIRHCRDELVEGAYIQTEQAMLEVPQSLYIEINQLMEEVLSYITRSLGRL